MTFERSNAKRALSLSVIAVSILLLTACGSAPTKLSPPLPESRPQADREKPTALMQVEAPPKPSPVAGLPPEEQARVAMQNYVELADWGVQCAASWVGLSGWINKR